MPSTVNGIGTHYYGKKNIQKRVGVCRSCGHSVELTSYDTRLWFVIVFIPIIPLGRKRILDYCPTCTRHYPVDVDKWETARQLEISGAQEKFRSTPTPDHAIAVHQQLLQFHQLDEADAFQKTMTEKFADNAKVHAYLGAALTHLGRLEEAVPCYARALALRPDLPEARAGVALGHVRAGRLEEARKLLDFLEQPGASKLYSLEPLDQLARAYQQANRHDDALVLFAIIQREVPKVAEEKWFRTLVARSEKDGGRRESQLPKVKFSWKRFLGLERAPRTAGGPQVTWRGLLIVGILLGLVGIVMAISNEYIRRHRTLHLVSGFKEPTLVEVRGHGTVRVSRGVSELTLPEGRFHAVINGPVKQELDFEIRSGYWGRWFDDAVWVLNVGGSAVLELVHATYSATPQPPDVTFAFGESFHHFTGVTHPFRELPERAESGSRLTSLDRFSGEPGAVFYYHAQKGNLREALRFAECWLGVHPEDDSLLMLYYASVLQAGQRARVEKFLHAGLTNRPILVQWHRYYQNLYRDRAHDAQLAAEYDTQLQTDPTNSMLMYLRGRVATGRAEGRDWFQRSSDADANNPFPLYARGYDRMVVGDWTGARSLLAQACQLRPEQPEFAESLSLTRLALKEYAAMEKELREQLEREPLNFHAANRLCEVLVGQGRADDAADFVRRFSLAASRKAVAASVAANLELRRHLLYLTGDFATLEKESAVARDDDAKITRFIALLELGRVDEAVQLVPLDAEGFVDPFHFLRTAIALRAAGNAAETSRWLARAAALMDQGDADLVRTAAVLRKATPPTDGELEEIAISTEAKATLAAMLAQLHPARRGEFAALARKLNIAQSYPHHLIERATAAK